MKPAPPVTRTNAPGLCTQIPPSNRASSLRLSLTRLRLRPRDGIPLSRAYTSRQVHQREVRPRVHLDTRSSWRRDHPAGVDEAQGRQLWLAGRRNKLADPDLPADLLSEIAAGGRLRSLARLPPAAGQPPGMPAIVRMAE